MRAAAGPLRGGAPCWSQGVVACCLLHVVCCVLHVACCLLHFLCCVQMHVVCGGRPDPPDCEGRHCEASRIARRRLYIHRCALRPPSTHHTASIRHSRSRAPSAWPTAALHAGADQPGWIVGTRGGLPPACVRACWWCVRVCLSACLLCKCVCESESKCERACVRAAARVGFA